MNKQFEPDDEELDQLLAEVSIPGGLLDQLRKIPDGNPQSQIISDTAVRSTPIDRSMETGDLLPVRKSLGHHPPKSEETGLANKSPIGTRKASDRNGLQLIVSSLAASLLLVTCALFAMQSDSAFSPSRMAREKDGASITSKWKSGNPIPAKSKSVRDLNLPNANQLTLQLEALRRESQAIDLRLQELELDRLAGRIQSLTPSVHVQTVSRKQENESIIFAVTAQSRMVFGRDSTEAIRDMEFVVANYPKTKGAEIATDFLQKNR